MEHALEKGYVRVCGGKRRRERDDQENGPERLLPALGWCGCLSRGSPSWCVSAHGPWNTFISQLFCVTQRFTS